MEPRIRFNSARRSTPAPRSLCLQPLLASESQTWPQPWYLEADIVVFWGFASECFFIFCLISREQSESWYFCISLVSQVVHTPIRSKRCGLFPTLPSKPGGEGADWLTFSIFKMIHFFPLWIHLSLIFTLIVALIVRMIQSCSNHCCFSLYMSHWLWCQYGKRENRITVPSTALLLL